ncbi:Glycoprotein endo-alpha-1,2-mannosidase [Holothuria leucospilota]|uniref:Glycoprotein endo-alpha-1,2-mannosidase n=1 Tax=Holothuria leucospilota TaxID=206669 RepID=A0A9Q1BHY7_HOLLE|nr:Glycoprotein endo-alpha-1,2-mannosidase [Holothuria leucospilota]
MIPRRFRSLRCIATFIVTLFLLGCISAVVVITRVVDLEGPMSLLEPFERGKSLMERNHGENKQQRENVIKESHDDKMADDEKAERGKKFINDMKGNVQNMTKLKSPRKKKLIKSEKIPKRNVSVTSYLREDVKKDSRIWSDIQPNYNLHAFYYPWYGNPDHNGNYYHWNHEYIPHWNKNVAKKWVTGIHSPPHDVGSNFYPHLGCYSSSDDDIIGEHMKQMRFAGIGVLVLSWYPPGKADGQGIPSDGLVPKIMDIAHEHQLKVAFHSEPYNGRSESTFANDVKYIVDSYGSHPAFYKYQGSKKAKEALPVFYLYDSYLLNATFWANIFRHGSPKSLRGTRYDGIFLALFVESKHRSEVLRGGFDGFYTYFASNRFTYGSTWTSWKILRQFASRSNLLFVPSVGPGYIDTRVRPWNGINTKWRDHGAYYKGSFEAAMSLNPPIVSITSFNEWHEGTQIEKAIPYRYGNFSYLDYTPNQPDYYLRLTRQLSEDLKHPNR